MRAGGIRPEVGFTVDFIPIAEEFRTHRGDRRLYAQAIDRGCAPLASKRLRRGQPIGASAVDRRDAFAIVKSVVDLAANLGMRTTAEGVETADQARCLRDLGCGQLQGYLITNRPRPGKSERGWRSIEQVRPSAGPLALGRRDHRWQLRA